VALQDINGGSGLAATPESFENSYLNIKDVALVKIVGDLVRHFAHHFSGDVELNPDLLLTPALVENLGSLAARCPFFELNVGDLAKRMQNGFEEFTASSGAVGGRVVLGLRVLVADSTTDVLNVNGGEVASFRSGGPLKSDNILEIAEFSKNWIETRTAKRVTHDDSPVVDEAKQMSVMGGEAGTEISTTKRFSWCHSAKSTPEVHWRNRKGGRKGAE